jgi:hypothetical protein
LDKLGDILEQEPELKRSKPWGVTCKISKGQEKKQCSNCKYTFFSDTAQSERSDDQFDFCSGDCLWSWRLSKIHVGDSDTPWAA